MGNQATRGTEEEQGMESVTCRKVTIHPVEDSDFLPDSTEYTVMASNQFSTVKKLSTDELVIEDLHEFSARSKVTIGGGVHDRIQVDYVPGTETGSHTPDHAQRANISFIEESE